MASLERITSDHPSLGRIQRSRHFRKWLAQAGKLAHIASDAEARRVAEFLDRHAAVAAPLPHNRLAYFPREDTLPVTKHVFIVPVLSSDSWRLPEDDSWQIYTKHNSDDTAGADFVPARRAIYMSGVWRLSPAWQGLLLLHEGLHAFDRVILRRHMPRPFWRRERNARLLEIRIMKAIGGPAFLRFIDSLLSEVAAQYRHQGSRFFFELRPTVADSSVLDRLFGAPISHDDRTRRILLVQNCAVHHFITQEHGSHAGIYYDAYVQRNYVSRGHS